MAGNVKPWLVLSLVSVAVYAVPVLTVGQGLEAPLGTVAQTSPAARLEEASRLLSLGIQQYRANQFWEALASLQAALEIYRERSIREAFPQQSRAGELTSLFEIGAIYASRGNYSEALDIYQQALALARNLDNRRSEAVALIKIGSIHNTLGSYSKALELYEQALAITRSLEDRASEVNALTGIGNVYLFKENYDRALDFYQQALEIVSGLDDRSSEAGLLNNIGIIYRAQGNYSDAINVYQRSLHFARSIGDRAGEARILANLGNAYRFQDNYGAAVVTYQQTLAIKRELGDRSGIATTLSNLGDAYNELEQHSQAAAALLESIEIFESLRYENLSDRQKIAFYDTQSRPYKGLQLALIAQGEIEQALEISERGRARAFASLLAERQGIPSADKPLTPPSISQIKELARQQKATLVQYSSIRAGRLPRKLFVYVVHPTGNVDFRDIDLSALNGSLESFIFAARRNMGVRDRNQDRSIAVAARNPDSNSTANLENLHRLLIDPIADLLPTNPEDSVIFVPCECLFLVPFAALIDAQGEYFIDRHTTLTAPSIQVLDLTLQNQRATDPNSFRPDDLLIVGNPDMPDLWNPEVETESPLDPLPGAEQEAIAIAKLFNTQPLLNDAATETTVTQRMSDARLIHLATHGLLDYGTPEETGVLDFPGAIALAADNTNDGLLTTSELLNMQLQAELVVLSACNTARGRVTGDGVVGLSRALITAGASNVMVSLWSVPDAPTADLMQEFYRQWQATGNKAQALRQAMLMTRETHPDPIDWAAFTLIGESR